MNVDDFGEIREEMCDECFEEAIRAMAVSGVSWMTADITGEPVILANEAYALWFATQVEKLRKPCLVTPFQGALCRRHMFDLARLVPDAGEATPAADAECAKDSQVEGQASAGSAA